MSNIKISEEEVQKKHYLFLTDKTIQRYNFELNMLMSLSLPTYILTEEGIKTKYKPDDAYEIQRIITLRDEYIKENYSDFFEKQI